MLYDGEKLMKAWKDFEGTEPVKPEQVTDDPDFLAFLEGSRLYEVSAETCTALWPLMRTETELRFMYNGTEYRSEGLLCGADVVHLKGKRFFLFNGSAAEELSELLRLKKTVQAICKFEQERASRVIWKKR